MHVRSQRAEGQRQKDELIGLICGFDVSGDSTMAVPAEYVEVVVRN